MLRLLLKVESGTQMRHFKISMKMKYYLFKVNQMLKD